MPVSQRLSRRRRPVLDDEDEEENRLEALEALVGPTLLNDRRAYPRLVAGFGEADTARARAAAELAVSAHPELYAHVPYAVREAPDGFGARLAWRAVRDAPAAYLSVPDSLRAADADGALALAACEAFPRAYTLVPPEVKRVLGPHVARHVVAHAPDMYAHVPHPWSADSGLFSRALDASGFSAAVFAAAPPEAHVDFLARSVFCRHAPIRELCAYADDPRVWQRLRPARLWRADGETETAPAELCDVFRAEDLAVIRARVEADADRALVTLFRIVLFARHPRTLARLWPPAVLEQLRRWAAEGSLAPREDALRDATGLFRE